MKQVRIKTHKRYKYYRIYAPSVFILFFIWDVLWLIAAINQANYLPS
jgi:hypothetical protein